MLLPIPGGIREKNISMSIFHMGRIGNAANFR
jgi:hypothetical protein